jgi:nicotinate-nucleotide adenylyltransferase
VQTELAPFHDRLNMLKLALPTTNNIICDIEQHLSAPSYTIHTLDVLTQKFPNNEWVLLLGADSWNSLPTWKDGSIIESQFSIFVYPRQDQNMLRTGHMTLLSGDFHNYSSTAIRNGIRSNTSAQCDVIPAVAEYITAHRLYL